MELWLEHLDPEWPTAPVFALRDVVDPIAAARYWRCPHPSSLIEVYDPNGDRHLTPPNLGALDRPDPDPDKTWNVLDPDGARGFRVVGDTGLDPVTSTV